MKFTLLLNALIITGITQACPTCTGRVTVTSPAYFSDSFYKPFAKNNTSDKNNQTQASKSIPITIGNNNER